MLPLAASAMLGKIIINRLLEAYGYRRFLVFNTIVLGLLAMCFAAIDTHTNIIAMIILFTILGTINSMQFTAMNTVTLIDLPREHESDGNGLLSVIMQLATSFGVAVGAMLLRLYQPLDQYAVSSPLSAFHFAYIVVGLTAVAASAIFLLTPQNAGRRGR